MRRHPSTTDRRTVQAVGKALADLVRERREATPTTAPTTLSDPSQLHCPSCRASFVEMLELLRHRGTCSVPTSRPPRRDTSAGAPVPPLGRRATPRRRVAP